ncbi:MAG TPA: TIGR02679 family protein [Actinomycetales bacterium]|nr:TIGR02679 family protein [Actinomycetales bacterium]
MTELPRWIADPHLATVWSRVLDRFEKAGLEPQGTVQVPLETRAERQAVGDLLGRSVTRTSVRIDLAALDSRLHERSAVGGLQAVLSRLGHHPQSRPAARAEREQSRQRPLEVATEIIDAPWVPEWVAGLRRSRLLRQGRGAETVVRDAATVLLELTASIERPAQSRVELAARVLGDAHALDRDRPVHQAVLRGLAAAAGEPAPISARQRQVLWSSAGVEPDLLSRTCLVWNLPLEGDSALAARLRLARESDDPVHVTEWDLRRAQPVVFPRGTKVLVCENPRVLEAMAERPVLGWSAVCTSGEANLVVDRVLTGLHACGADLRYHGDFDWPGVAIANRAIGRYHAEPLRMSADDYLRAVRGDGPELQSGVVEPVWDAELGAAMRSHGRAVHEESVLGDLLDMLIHDRAN